MRVQICYRPDYRTVSKQIYWISALGLDLVGADSGNFKIVEFHCNKNSFRDTRSCFHKLVPNMWVVLTRETINTDYNKHVLCSDGPLVLALEFIVFLV